jgi:hypothetical protein
MGKYSKKKRKHSKQYRIAMVQRAIVAILILTLAIMITSITQRVKYENLIKEINATHEEDMIALRIELRDQYESEIAAIEKYYEYGGDVSQIEREAEWIAKVMYGMAKPDHKDSDLRAIVWCILNRVDNKAYPGEVQAVCQQKSQWMGYSDDNPVIAKLYDIALAELKKWHGDAVRPMSADYVYLTWSSKEILLRDTFAENRSTNYWRMN